MNFPSNYREAFEEAVRIGLVSEEDFTKLECRVDRDQIGRSTHQRYYVDGRFIFELTYDMFACDFTLRFAGPARTPHKPNSRLAAHEARWSNTP